MAERGAIFTAESVQAIQRVEFPKTQTRRLVKPQPEVRRGDDVRWAHGGGNSGPDHYLRGIAAQFWCPYGKPGARLWVRESFAEICNVGDTECWCPDGDHSQHTVEYRADTDGTTLPGGWPKDDPDRLRWRSPLHMPRWASRLTLEITEVRVERLHDISTDDIKAEGVMLPVEQAGKKHVRPLLAIPNPYDPGKKLEAWTIDDFWKAAWAYGWDQINRKRAPWASNPFVWAISFKKVRQ